MTNIAILEDDASAAKMLQYVLNTYASKNDQIFNIKHYTNAESLLADVKNSFDIAFLDIEMDGMNGMEAAFALRELDQRMIIIFVTNMAQYAVKGYEVNALYYILKPVTYQDVAHKLQRALNILASNVDSDIVIRQNSGISRIPLYSLMYIEITNHKLLYHAESKTYTAYGSLSDVENDLQGRGFFRCNSCYLVNARFIASVDGHSITLRNGTLLQISHPRKKRFMTDFGNWLGEGNS